MKKIKEKFFASEKWCANQFNFLFLSIKVTYQIEINPRLEVE